MNQILYTGGKNSMPNMQKIIIFFVIFIIVFAICLIALGTNLFTKVKNENVANTNTTQNTPPNNQTEQPDTPIQPTVEEANVNIIFESEMKSVREVTIKVKSLDETEIQAISYWWDEDKPTKVNEIQEEIVIKSQQGKEILHVEVTDENGNKKVAEEANVNVTFASEIGGVKIQAKGIDDRKIETISYWWDEEEPTTTEVSNKEYETVVPSRQGRHTLYVEVTDENENKKTEKQLVIGDAAPEEVKITTDGISNYVITAKDDEGIEKLVIVLNGETQEIKFEDKPKEIEHKVPIPQGYSLIDVTVYNVNGLSTNAKAKITNFGG